MICKGCNHNKSNYHFFNFRNNYKVAKSTFFTRPIDEIDRLCFDCAAPYRCLGCGAVKGASEFRLQGRYCLDCRNRPLSIRTGLNFDLQTEKDAEYVEALENAEISGNEGL